MAGKHHDTIELRSTASSLIFSLILAEPFFPALSLPRVAVVSPLNPHVILKIRPSFSSAYFKHQYLRDTRKNSIVYFP
jgi:hypothetical protein